MLEINTNEHCVPELIDNLNQIKFNFLSIQDFTAFRHELYEHFMTYDEFYRENLPVEPTCGVLLAPDNFPAQWVEPLQDGFEKLVFLDYPLVTEENLGRFLQDLFARMDLLGFTQEVLQIFDPAAVEGGGWEEIQKIFWSLRQPVE